MSLELGLIMAGSMLAACGTCWWLGGRSKTEDSFAKGYAAVAVSKTESGSAYQLVPWSEF